MKRKTEILVGTLDTLDVFSKWFLSVAVVIWWAGLSSVSQIEILGIKIERNKSFAVAGFFFVVMNVVFYQYFRRVRLISRSSADDKKQEFLSALFFHPWILNPFGIYSDVDANKNILSGFHISFLVIIWWMCNMSLYALYPIYSIHAGATVEWGLYILITLLFALFGLLTLKELLAIFSNLKLAVELADEDIKKLFKAQFTSFELMLSAGVLLGFSITITIIFLL